MTLYKHSQISQKILLSGSSGLVGSVLSTYLRQLGHEVWHLVRGSKATQKHTVQWDPNAGKFCKEDFEGFDAVIHLAGENIAGKRWSAKRKNVLFQSRCRDTWLLCQVLEKRLRPPKTFLCASAVGIYGDRGQEELTEESSPGTGFLADLCQRWEAASQSLESKGCRVVRLRFGYILSSKGGMLQKMLPAFKMGLGGRLGDGMQIMPWVALEDVIGAIYHALIKEGIKGAVNVVAPYPVSQQAFSKAVAHHLHRPALLNLPKWVLRLVLGERADALLLTSINAHPKRLLESGYDFSCKHLEDALSRFS